MLVQKSPKSSKESLPLSDTQVPRSTFARASSLALPCPRLSGCELVSCAFGWIAMSALLSCLFFASLLGPIPFPLPGSAGSGWESSSWLRVWGHQCPSKPKERDVGMLHRSAPCWAL